MKSHLNTFCFRLFFAAFYCGVTIGMAMCFGTVWAATEGADQVFDERKDQVVQIRIVEASSGAKATVGSGFMVSSEGHIVTNYHVISQLIHKPQQYRGEIIHHDEYTSPLTLLNFDAIHDLAVVQTDRPQSSYFTFHTEPMKKGVRVYSMGNPWDLGMTIVEGTHSGLVENSLYEKIHFTGSLNGGMSGGPAVTLQGSVLGVNVASAGDQLSFLVPAKFSKRLLEQTASGELENSQSWMLKLRDQLVEHQATYLNKILSQDWLMTSLGPYRVPGEIATFVKCWGNSVQRKKWLYATVTQTCSFEDGVYLTQALSSGTLKVNHRYISSDQLNRFRFYSLYQSQFQDDFLENVSEWFEDEEEVGLFHCVDDFVVQTGLKMKLVFCVRGYKKLPGLYDSVLKVATLDRDQMGLQTTVEITGVTFEKAQAFGQKFIGSIGFNHDSD